LQEEIEILRE